MAVEEVLLGRAAHGWDLLPVADLAMTSFPSTLVQDLEVLLLHVARLTTRGLLQASI